MQLVRKYLWIVRVFPRHHLDLLLSATATFADNLGTSTDDAQDMSTSKNKDSTKSSSLLSASEGVVGIFTTVCEKKNAGKSGGVGVGHCNREQAVRILRRVVFGSA